MQCSSTKKKGFVIIAFLSAVVLTLSLGIGISASASANTANTQIEKGQNITGAVNVQMVWPKKTIRGTSTFEISNALSGSQDNITISDYGATPAEGLKYLGFKTLAVMFEIELWEINDGYQDFFIYYGFNEGGSKYTEYKGLEHNCGQADTKPKIYKFYFEIPVTEHFSIRYGAHGAGKNVWINQNLKMSIGASQEYAKITNLQPIV